MKPTSRLRGLVATGAAVLLEATLAAVLASAPAAAQVVTGTLGSPSATTTIPGNQIPAPEPKFGGTITEDARTFGAPLRGATVGGHQGLDVRASSVIVPPNFGSGAGIWLPGIVVVALGEPSVPVTTWAMAGAAASVAASRKAAPVAARPNTLDFCFMLCAPSFCDPTAAQRCATTSHGKVVQCSCSSRACSYLDATGPATLSIAASSALPAKGLVR